MQAATLPVFPIGHSAVPLGHVAAVVTHLEMRESPLLRPARPFPPGCDLQPINNQDLDAYRVLFRAVGEEWLWSLRLTMPNEELRAILDDSRTEVFALRRGGDDIGILELDFRETDECELAYFGLVTGMVGKGIGRALMNEATKRAWSRPIKRFWVHTCSLDHPAALDFYQRSGFVAYARSVEVFPDPRLAGVLPPNCASSIPLLEGQRGTHPDGQ